MGMRLVSRSLLVCVLGVAFGACSQAVVAAATELHGEEVASPAGSLTGAPLVVAGADRLFLGGEETQATREARRSNPVAVAARQASRTSFESLAPGQAAGEAKAAFPSLIGRSAGGPPQLPAGQHIVRYATDNAAQVSLPWDGIGVIESLEPIAAGTSHGHHAPLDLRLEETGGHFQPVLSDVGVDVPRILSSGVSLSETGVSLTPVDEHGSSLAASAGALDGSAVLWSDSDSDAGGVHDLATLAKPSPEGFDLTSMLLSQRSPGVLYFRVGVPAGAHLERAEDGSVRVVKDGVTLAIVSPVSAQDAEGSNVPVSMDVHGDVLVLTVDLSGDYLYPIAVDPEVNDGQLATISGGKHSNWEFHTNNSSEFAGSAVYEGVGKEHLETKGIAEYKATDFAYWGYQTKGNSKVYELKTETSAKNVSAWIESFLEFEEPGGAQETKKILSTKETEPEYEKKVSVLCAANSSKVEECLPAAGKEHNAVHFQQSATKAPGSSYKFSDTMSQGIVSISEPTGTHSTTSFNTIATELEVEVENGKKEKEKVKQPNVLHGTGSWLTKFKGAFETVAKDTGIGVAATKLEYESSAGTWEQIAEHNYLEKENACQGVQCYETHGEVWTLPKLPDGADKIRYKAEEAMSGTQSLESEGQATVKVDTSAPHAIDLEGLPWGNELSEREYELTTEATDGEGTTVASSGLKSIVLYIDGKAVEDKEEKAKESKEEGKKEGQCSTLKGECTAKAKWTVNGAELGAGHHSIQVVALDNAGNEARLPGGGTQISIRHSTPVAIGPGSVNLQSGDFSLGANDVSLGSGLTVSRNYSSRATEAGIEGALGPQWSMSLGNSESLTELVDGAVMLTASDGKQSIFANLGEGKFEAPNGDSNLKLELEENKATKEKLSYYLKDPAAGTSDKFTLPAGSKLWVPTKQEGAVATDTITYAYKTVDHQDEFSLPSSEAKIEGVTTGPDGNIWYTEGHGDKIGKMSPAGVVLAEYATEGEAERKVPGPNIVTGSDGSLWFLQGMATSGRKTTIVKITTSGKQTKYELHDEAAYLTAGPDGNMWFSEPLSKKIGKITPTGTISQYTVTNGEPYSITAGPHGNVWFVTSQTGKIDEISPTTGVVTEHAAPSINVRFGAQSLAMGPDGNVWFSEPGKIDKMTPGGVVTPYPLSSGSQSTETIIAGPDKNIWFSQALGSNYMGKITPSGVITEYALERSFGMASGPDGNIWFTDNANKTIDRTTTTVKLDEPTEVLAPVPAGVSCSPELKAGCRALKFWYASGTNAWGENQSEWGEYEGRLSRIDIEAYDPSTKKMEETVVAQYKYDKLGRLRTEWDPHMSGLKTAYGYDAEGHVTALTPPGQETWAFTYGAIVGDAGTGRLLKVTRAPASEALWSGETVKNTGAPTITGSPVVGARMAVSDGTWSGSPITHSYQWASCTSAGVCMSIAGATSANYAPTVGDEGHTLVAFVTATNGGGAAVAESAATSAVQAFASTQFTEYALPSASLPSGITSGPDGNVWFTDAGTGKAGKITSSGTVTEYTANTAGPDGITSGPDGNLWFVEKAVHRVNHMTPSGTLTTYNLTRSNTFNLGITAGSDKNLWFTESSAGYIGKITTGDEVLGEYALPTGSSPHGITMGPDGNLWSTEYGTSKIGKITTSGTITEYGLASGSKPWEIVTGADGNLWFTDSGTSKIGKITTSGTITEYALPSGSEPYGITTGPGGNVWFTDYGTSKIGRVTTTGTIAEYALPAGSKPMGIAEGPDGNMWYTDYGTNKIGKISFAGGEYHAPQPGSTIDYNVPLQGTTAPDQMGVNSATHKPEPEKWGQSDDPVEATAIFPPDEPQGWPASGYKRATVHYLDEQGRQVNVASPSTSANGSVSTTEYNEYNDVVRTLSPDNRQVALETGSKSIEVSKLLDTQSTYNGEGAKEGEVEEPGTRLIESFGPEHEIKYTPNGFSGRKESLARLHTKYFYDEGAPGGEKYDLVTEMSQLAQTFNGEGKVEEEVEVRKTTTSYSGQSNLGWELRAPTSVTEASESEGLKIKHTTLYNKTTGQITESRGPAGAAGESAHDTRIVYYGAEANTEGFAACGGHPEWAGLVCETLPAKQPAGGVASKLPVTTTTYNMMNEPLVITETFGSTVRTKTNTYIGVGRLSASETTSTADTPLPLVNFEYNSTNGSLQGVRTTVEGKTKQVTTRYNTLGQLTEYIDADGNTAKYKYAGLENDGLLEEVSDGGGAGTGKQSYTYNPTTKLMEKLTDSSAGTFTASYDAEGKLASEVYPNGMCANDTYNAAGEATHVEYIKTSNCAEHEPGVWFSETRTPSVRGETFSRTSTLASEEYFYDTVGRLTEAQETPTGEGCTTRLYGYDEEANRTSQTTRAPAGEGKCATSGGTTLAHIYDEGNRLTDSGIAYDAFGNVTKLPAADAEGHELVSTFYVDGAVATQSQNGVSNSYYLDPEGRVRETISGTTTTIDHYDGSGEAVAWTSEGANSKRNIPGIDGALAATQTNSETPVLQLHDLQGDVVATIGDKSGETKLLSTYNSTEFGVPNGGKAPPKFAWLGGMGIESSLSSGVITYGATSYVPQTGRALQSKQVEPPGLSGGSGAGAAYTMQEEPWNMQGAAREGAEAPGLEAAREQAALEAAMRAALEGEGIDPEGYITRGQANWAGNNLKFDAEGEQAYTDATLVLGLMDDAIEWLAGQIVDEFVGTAKIIDWTHKFGAKLSGCSKAVVFSFCRVHWKLRHVEISTPFGGIKLFEFPDYDYVPEVEECSSNISGPFQVCTRIPHK